MVRGVSRSLNDLAGSFDRTIKPTAPTRSLRDQPWWWARPLHTCGIQIATHGVEKGPLPDRFINHW